MCTSYSTINTLTQTHTARFPYYSHSITYIQLQQQEPIMRFSIFFLCSILFVRIECFVWLRECVTCWPYVGDSYTRRLHSCYSPFENATDEDIDVVDNDECAA